jgi:hypothetical protein
MKRTKHQQQAYAIHRRGLAADRAIRAKTEAEKAQAGRWVLAWHTKSK